MGLLLFQTCNAAFNFASPNEAEKFKRKVEEKLQAREQRKIGEYWYFH